jgi:hypothetical protein
MLNKTALSLLALSSSDEEKLLRAHLLIADAKEKNSFIVLDLATSGSVAKIDFKHDKADLPFAWSFIRTSHGCRVNLVDLMNEPSGTYVVYRHWISAENNKYAWQGNNAYGLTRSTEKSYIGITSRHWSSRLAEHRSSASTGSPFLFHRALAETENNYPATIDLLRVGISEEEANAEEERFVRELSLYPLGLNMIPGGKAGLAWLAKNGVFVKRKNEDKPWVAVKSLFERSQGNPLLALRLQTDDDLYTRIVCNNPNNFSATEVARIRLMDNLGWSHKQIALSLNCRETRIRDLLERKTYVRVAG